VVTGPGSEMSTSHSSKEKSLVPTKNSHFLLMLKTIPDFGKDLTSLKKW